MVTTRRWRWRHRQSAGGRTAMALRLAVACLFVPALLLLLLLQRSMESESVQGRSSEESDLAVELPNGAFMPRVGFGTAGLGEGTERATAWALQAGYRLIDSAQAPEWYNEKAVGRAIISSDISRDQLFLVSKLHPRHLGYELTKQQFSTSLQDLGTSYLDLFLLHYSRCFPGLCNPSSGTWQESWRALEELHDEQKIKAIGVSNFNKEELQELLDLARVKPSVVQRNSDPFNPDVEIQEYCQQQGIQYMGYSTLGSQWLMRGYHTNPVLNDPIIKGIAAGQDCTCAQVVLRWALEKNQVVVPRSSNQLRIIENLEAPHCNLTAIQVTQIDGMYRRLPPLVDDV